MTTYKKRSRSPEKQQKRDAFTLMARQLAGEIETAQGASPQTLDEIDERRCSPATVHAIRKARGLPGLERFSPRNQLLITMQDPDATEAYTYRGWLEQGKQVRKGEECIYILAPRTSKNDEGERTLTGMGPLAVFSQNQVDDAVQEETKEEEEEEDEQE